MEDTIGFNCHPVWSGGHLLRRIPTGYTATLASDVNSITSNVTGVGRFVGSLLSSAGRRLEKAIDNFAEQQLGLGPNITTVHLIEALHDIHAEKTWLKDEDNRLLLSCRSEHIKSADNLTNTVMDRLIWVCNGVCSQCGGPYIPAVLGDVPDTVRKALAQLLSFLRYECVN
jgi:hypothetical protein